MGEDLTPSLSGWNEEDLPPSLSVFASATGRPLNWRNLGGSPPKGRSAGRGLGAALVKAGVPGEGKHKVRFHDLRHTFASLLIAQGVTSCSSPGRWATRTRRSRCRSTLTCSMAHVTLIRPEMR